MTDTRVKRGTYHKRYYQEHKENYLTRIKCECGREIYESAKKKHLESNIHKLLMIIKNSGDK